MRTNGCTITKTKILLIFWFISSLAIFLGLYYISDTLPESLMAPGVTEDDLPGFDYYRSAIVSIAAPVLLYLAWYLNELRKG